MRLHGRLLGQLDPVVRLALARAAKGAAALGTVTQVLAGAFVNVTPSTPDASTYTVSLAAGTSAVARVANVAALSALTRGALAIVDSVGALWTYEAAGALTVDGITVAAATGIGEGQWWRGPTLIGGAALAQENWFVDPAGGTDQNSGTDSGHAIKTLAEIVRRLGTSTPNLTVPVAVELLGDIPSSDPWPLFPVTASAGLKVIGTTQLIATATIGIFTARDNAAGTMNTITANGETGAFWTPFVGKVIEDTTAGAWFTVIADLGTATAEISEPLGLGTFAPAPVTIADGDALSIFNRSALTLPLEATQGINGTTYSLLLLQAGVLQLNGRALFDRCRNNSTTIEAQGLGIATQWANCDLAAIYEGGGNFYGGVARELNDYRGTDFAACDFDGYIVLLSRSHVFGAITLRTAGLFGGSWLEDDTQPNYVRVLTPQTIYGPNPIVWGTASLSLQAGSLVRIKGSAVTSILLTGGITIDGASTAFPWNAGGAAFGAAIAINPANLDAQGSLQNPATGTRVLVTVG